MKRASLRHEKSVRSKTLSTDQHKIAVQLCNTTLEIQCHNGSNCTLQVMLNSSIALIKTVQKRIIWNRKHEKVLKAYGIQNRGQRQSAPGKSARSVEPVIPAADPPGSACPSLLVLQRIRRETRAPRCYSCSGSAGKRVPLALPPETIGASARLQSSCSPMQDPNWMLCDRNNEF